MTDEPIRTTADADQAPDADPVPDFTLCGQFLDDVSMPLSALGTELHDQTRKALQLAIAAPGKAIVVGTFEVGAEKFADRFRKGQADVLTSWHRSTHPELPGTFKIQTLRRVLREAPHVERFVYVTYRPAA